MCALLDEAVCSVLADDLHPMIVGWVFCRLLITCFEMADMTRAAEWTRGGGFLVRVPPAHHPLPGSLPRAPRQVRTMRGEWKGAEADAFRASAELLALESMGAVRLRALHPHALTDPAGIDAVADLFDDAGVVAV